MKKIVYAFTLALLVLVAFASGFVSCLHMKSGAQTAVRAGYLLAKGDAPTDVRSGVLIALRDFQGGYVKRDVNDIDSFANELLAKDDILILGTDSGEWIRGYPAAKDFIENDWRDWGDFRFSVDDSIIWSSGNAAWVSSIGNVHFKGRDRPVRFTAVLTNEGGSWLFRELHFQWDERDPSVGDLSRPMTYLTVFKLAIHRVTGNAN